MARICGRDVLHCNDIEPFVTLMGNFNWGPNLRNEYENINDIQPLLDSERRGILFFQLIIVEMPTIVGILTFVTRKNFMLS